MRDNLKVTFVSNYISHHQIPFSDAMYKLLGSDYCFISTFPMDSERKSMGWEVKSSFPYEIKAYGSDALMEKARNLVDESDIVIIGSAPDYFIVKRLKNRKLTFKYSERLYKQGLSFKKIPRAIVSSYIHHRKFQKYPLYMLCASAYTAVDTAIFGNYNNKTYKWGYFPELKLYDIKKLINNKNDKVINILWVGRFLDWKHPELALDVAQSLEKENIDFNMKMIGSGENYEQIKIMAKNMNLKNIIDFLGTMSPQEVRRHMNEANIYLFTSDFNEGWGAVLNEAMNSGCAVVASHSIGSVPYLIKHGENGLIYQNGDSDDLCKNVLKLAKDVKLRETLGSNAYLTIKNIWNSEIAANRFLKFSESLMSGEVLQYTEGPCSKAPIIKNNWFRKKQHFDCKES